jgi:hypothetical protein
MAEQYVKTVGEHVKSVILTYQEDWDEILNIFLVACS